MVSKLAPLPQRYNKSLPLLACFVFTRAAVTLITNLKEGGMSTNAHHQDNNAAAKQHSAPTSKGATPPHAPAHIGEKAAFGGGMAEGVSFFERNSQHDKYHSPQGHGFAAEDANALNDMLHGRHVEKVGTSNELNGADRIVDNVKIQVKYCQDAQSTFEALFDLMGACAYPTRKSGDKQAKSVRCTYNATAL